MLGIAGDASGKPHRGFQKLSGHALQKNPEQLLAETLGPLLESLCGVGKEVQGVNMGPIVQAMDRLETVIGSPEENRTAAEIAEPSLVERTLADIAHVISDQCEEKLAELAVTLLENPTYRLAGAEGTLRQFCATVEQALQSQETLAKELTEKARILHERILQLLDSHLKNGSATNITLKISRKATGKGAPPSARDVFELVRTYANALP